MSADARVLVVDDQELVAQALAVFVDGTPGLAVAGFAADGAEAVAQCARLSPDVVLMDVSMPVLDGIAATARITAAQPGVRVIVVTTLANPDSVVPALRAGACGYLLKNSSPEQLVAAIRDALAGGAPISPVLTGALVHEIRTYPGSAPRPPASPLTPKELDVVALLAQGLSNGEIARELRLSEAAVKSRFTQVMTKLGADNRVQVLVRACELGLAVPRSRAAGENRPT